MDQNRSDYVAQVAAGYDVIGDLYFKKYTTDIPATVTEYIDAFTLRMPPGGTVLELGCGNGLPVAATLAQQFNTLGIDVSPRQVERARANVPTAKFLEADMASMSFPEGSFDGILALYSIIHVPRE
ncbi:MAG: class I SAM-dependent methyltransferase [Chloroflexi bacterium]|nr:class I SAM-dependent methyltransferase [Chloroflexota bacterium]